MPVEWESRTAMNSWANCRKCDDSLKSFLFILKHYAGIAPRKFPLKAKEKSFAIYRISQYGPIFGEGDLFINESPNGYPALGMSSKNDTFFTRSLLLNVKEIEVFA
jgi:hypothetical protein